MTSVQGLPAITGNVCICQSKQIRKCRHGCVEISMEGIAELRLNSRAGSRENIGESGQLPANS